MQTQVASSICVKMFKVLKLIPDTEQFQHPSNLIGIKIPKENIMKEGQLELITPLLNELRGFYSASGMSCLRTSGAKSKTPVINALRQICKANGVLMKPYSKSNGYEPSGKKKISRWFEIHSMDESLDDSRCHEQMAKPEKIEAENLLIENAREDSSAKHLSIQ